MHSFALRVNFWKLLLKLVSVLIYEWNNEGGTLLPFFCCHDLFQLGQGEHSYRQWGSIASSSHSILSSCCWFHEKEVLFSAMEAKVSPKQRKKLLFDLSLQGLWGTNEGILSWALCRSTESPCISCDFRVNRRASYIVVWLRGALVYQPCVGRLPLRHPRTHFFSVPCDQHPRGPLLMLLHWSGYITQRWSPSRR